jgi:pimeloyl-ACP methyl ester carboxylesterase
MPHLLQEYTIIAPHLHGHGHSSHRTTYTTSYYREDVTDIIALLDALQIERVLVLGFSDGAIVGLLLAALHPDRVIAVAPARRTTIDHNTRYGGDPFLAPRKAALSHLARATELARIRCPTLTMHGIRDRVVAVEYASMLSQYIPGAQLRLFDVGHALHLRCADEYITTVMNFFGSILPGEPDRLTIRHR